MGENKEVSTDAKNTAKDMIEIIVNKVMRTITKQTGSCDGTLEELKLDPCIKKEVSCSINVKDKLLEKQKDLEIENTLLLTSHFRENAYTSYTSSPDVCIQCPTLSTTSPQGEGDFQIPSYQMAVDISKSTLSKCCCHKSSSTTSLTFSTLHNETIDNLHNNIYSLSFDNIDSIIKAEITDDNTKVNLENKTTHAYKESFNLEEVDSHTNSENMPDSDQPELKKSKKFWHYNKTQYFPASIDQLPPNFCELVSESDENILLESKYNEELSERLSQTSEELIVSVVSDKNDCVQNVLLTNPSRYPIVLSPTSYPNTLNNSKTQISSTVKDVNIKPEQNFENLIEIENPTDTEDVENDLFETREYWSNTGLITENKVNRKCVYSIPDSVGIESIQNVTPVKEICFMLNHKKEDFQLSNNLQSQSNSNQVIETKVNYLSFPEKSKKKKRKPFVTRLTSSISQIFRFKKNTQSENKC